MMNNTITATPTKLRSGSWGARVCSADVATDDIVTITTRSGKSWQARITRIVWAGDDVAICATESLDTTPRRHRPRRAPNSECTCGACEDLLSFGYRPGQRIRCSECGGWAEAY